MLPVMKIILVTLTYALIVLNSAGIFPVVTGCAAVVTAGVTLGILLRSALSVLAGNAG